MTVVRGKYLPQPDTARPELASIVGQEFSFEYVGLSEGGPLEGHHMWMFGPEDKAMMDPRMRGLWVPEQDIDPTPST